MKPSTLVRRALPSLVVTLLFAGSAQADPITLRTADGKALQAQAHGSGQRGVVLVHDAGRSAADWEGFAARLAGNGFRVVALDLRGHGASAAVAPALADADWPLMVQDVDAAAAWLASKGATQVAVVGAAVGANLALNAASDNPQVTDVVLLSPTLSGRGVKLTDALAAWKGPLLVVADAENVADARTATVLAAQAGGQARVELVPAGATGHRMLNTAAAVEPLLVGWLSGARGEATDVLDTRRPAGPAAPAAIETTGKAYGDPP